MDRRSFLKIGTTAAVAMSLPDIKSSAAGKHDDIILYGAAVPGGMHVRFNGTGAAGGRMNGAERRHSSILIDSRILIDLTDDNIGMIPGGCIPEAVFYTHSHNDHYNPAAALKAGIKEVFVSETWLDRARSDFRKAAAGGAVPKVTPLALGQRVVSGDLTITALPGNHATADAEEQTLIYLLEKGGARVLYATDTGGIPVRAARIVGIDAHINPLKPITALIMEATMASDDDFRIFTHSSTGVVQRTFSSLRKAGGITPPDGQVPVILTHISDPLHPDSGAPSPLLKAFDGMEVVFNAPGRKLKVGTAGENWYDTSFDGFAFGEALPRESMDPMFLAAGQDGVEYVISERKGHSGVYSFKDARCTGFVAFNEKDVPCHVMRPGGLPYVCAANYTGGSVCVVALDGDGNVSRLAKTFNYGSKSHCHQMKEIPAGIASATGIEGRWILATDLGLSCVHVFEAGKTGLKDVASFKCPTGPRHMEFNLNNNLLYVLTELSDELLTFSIGSKGGRPVFKEIDRRVAADIEGHGGADIHLHPSGKFLYTSHRLVNDGVAIFSVGPDGIPSKLGYQRTGEHPRNFAITPDGLSLLVACRDTSSIEAYRIKEGGLLEKVTEKAFTDKPVCLVFD